MQLKDIKGIVEYNSSYILGELGRKFQDFIRNYDSLGLKVDGYKVDLGNRENTEIEEDGVLLEAMNESRIEDVPSTWVLVDDNELHPVFKSVITDVDAVALDRALQQHSLDIVQLKTELSEIVKNVSFNVGGENLQFSGTLTEIQKAVIDYFQYDSVKQEIFKQLIDCFYSDKEVISSFFVTIPKHFEAIVLKINC